MQTLSAGCQRQVNVPRFFIHVRKGDFLVRDDEGWEAPDLNAAKELAIKTARQLLADEIKAGASDLIQCVVVADVRGNELLTISASDLLPDR